MISIKDLVDMPFTEAISGGSYEHYFDESQNQVLVPEQNADKYDSGPKDSFKFRQELVKHPDGSYEWAE